MTGDAAASSAGGPVLAVLADLRYWSDRGVRIVAVEPGADDGVRVGVTDHAATAERALQGHYPFPVTCWPAT